jgi:hypothetical protein
MLGTRAAQADLNPAGQPAIFLSNGFSPFPFFAHFKGAEQNRGDSQHE